MNNIYKLFTGHYIDMSHILSIGKIWLNKYAIYTSPFNGATAEFSIEFMFRDKPILYQDCLTAFHLPGQYSNDDEWDKINKTFYGRVKRGDYDSLREELNILNASEFEKSKLKYQEFIEDFKKYQSSRQRSATAEYEQ